MKPGKLMVIVGAILFVSLSINLFMAGMVVGSSVGELHNVTLDPVAQQDRQLRASLAEADKLVLKQAMDFNRKKITQLHDDIENIKKDVRGIIKKEPLDEQALGEALESEKNKKLALLRLAHETRKMAMEKMSPEGRGILSRVERLGFNLNNNNSIQCH